MSVSYRIYDSLIPLAKPTIEIVTWFQRYWEKNCTLRDVSVFVYIGMRGGDIFLDILQAIYRNRVNQFRIFIYTYAYIESILYSDVYLYKAREELWIFDKVDEPSTELVQAKLLVEKGLSVQKNNIGFC